MIRAKIVLLAAAGWENTVIADRLDMPVQLVSQWRKRCYEEGLDETVSFTLDGDRRHGHAGAWPRHQLPMPRAHPTVLESPERSDMMGRSPNSPRRFRDDNRYRPDRQRPSAELNGFGTWPVPAGPFSMAA